jgi:hypothetical protein
MSRAWQAARAARAERRRLDPQVIQQPRQSEGFIIKVDDSGSTILYDPGPKDRQLWMEANTARQDEARAERKGKKRHGK